MHEIDPSDDFLAKKQMQKERTLQPGDIIGSFEGNRNELKEFSAICKTDCILLEMNQGLFEIVKKQQIKKEKENIAKFIILAIP